MFFIRLVRSTHQRKLVGNGEVGKVLHVPLLGGFSHCRGGSVRARSEGGGNDRVGQANVC